MSFNGIRIFDRNLRTLMKSKGWECADDGQKFDLGYRLLNSKYGVHAISAPHELKAAENRAAESE